MIRKLLSTLAFIGFFAAHLCAQGTNSPYSRLSIGDLLEQSSIVNQGMGGVGVSVTSLASVNFMNPAQLSYNTMTSFEAGARIEYKYLQDAERDQNDFAGNLQSMVFSFPIAKKMALAAGMQPYSSVSYEASRYEYLPSSGTFVEYNYLGSGGLTQVFLAAGWRPVGNLSIGGRINYNFGATMNQSQSKLDDGGALYIIELHDRFSYSDFSGQLGIHYRAYLDPLKESSFNIGGTYNLAADLQGDFFRALQRKTFTGALAASDTIFYGKRSIATIPAGFRMGLSYQKLMKYSIGIEYASQDWSNGGMSESMDSLSIGSSLHIGGEWIPNARSVNFFERVVYRAGLSYAQSPAIINGHALVDVNASLGFSVPVGNGRSFSSLNLAFVYGKRGNAKYDQITENYLRFSIGANISDRWFVRRRYD